ncbi:MAG: glycosyltransferase family 2 protein [Candidatus Limnocylindrales bacterium]
MVIPTLNEADNLTHVLPRLPDFLSEVIIVDGESTDGTVEVARRLRPDVRVVRQIGRGKGTALRQGFAAARGDIIVSMDADGSTAPEEIAGFVDALMAGAHYVKGSRFMRGGSSEDLTLLRSSGNVGLTLLVRLLHGAHFTDLCYGYNAFWSRVLPSLHLRSTGFEIETEMNLRAHHAGLRVVEIPSREMDRIHGESHLQTFPDGWRVLKTILRERVRRVPATGVAPVPVPIHRPAMVAIAIQPDPVPELLPDGGFAVEEDYPLAGAR